MLERFFGRYAAAFLDFNPNYISEVYDFPMIFYTESGDSVSFEENAFLENTKKLIELYGRLGIKQVDFDIQSKHQLSAKLELVSVVWHFKTAKNREVYQATTRYVVRQSDSGFKIKSVFVVDETSKIAQLKQS